MRPISGGLLMQQRDHVDADRATTRPTWTLATGEAASPEVLADLAFAWRACRAVKSNAILLAKDGASVGVGMGQVNRVDSCKLAVARAGERAAGSVAASDAFFPFEDGPQILIDAGVAAIVQPGGSVRDELTIEACKAAGVTMYFTGTRHFATRRRASGAAVRRSSSARDRGSEVVTAMSRPPASSQLQPPATTPMTG